MVHSNRFLTPSHAMEEKRLSAWELNQVRICACQHCPRLVAYRKQVAAKKTCAQKSKDYWGKPVPGFGDPFARLMVLGLSPSACGSSRTGRMFTGDACGDFLFNALYRAGLANQPQSQEFGDEILVRDVYISAVGRCVAPKNRPLLSELDSCQKYLETEIRLLDRLEGIIVLGHAAFDRLLIILRTLGAAVPEIEFRHGELFRLGEKYPWVLCSYHPSRQNTQTGRLNQQMFDRIWDQAVALVK